METDKANEKAFIDKVWDFFASIKLAAVTFGLIAISSIIGTVIEQGGEPEKNLELLTNLFGKDLAPTLYRISDALGFMDMYHSWWFVTFLVIFITNLIICSLERLPNRWKVIKQPLNPLALDKFGAYSIRNEVSLSKKPDELRESLRHAMKRIGFNAREVSDDNNTQFYSQKGTYSRLGVYITHLSIICIMVGAVIGIFFGFNGFLNLPEGYSSKVAYSRQDGTAHQLGFTVKLDDFDVEFYEGKDTPKDYRSWLTVSKSGQVVKKQMIEVNTPLKFEGYTFYQSSYGMMPNPQGTFIFNVISNTGNSEVINVALNESFSIPGTDIMGKPIQFSPALAFRQDGSTFTYSEMMNNPGVQMAFSRGGKDLYSGWLLKRYPKTWDLPDGNRVEFIDYWGSQYTGMQVRKDPGVWTVYLGCLIMSVGLYMAFFMSHRKIWVALKPEGKNGSKVLIAATANKNKPSYEREIDKLVSIITKQS